MKIYQQSLTKTELMRRVGNLAQIGGVQLLRSEDGPSRGVRLLEFRLGSGFNFKVAVDRGMDVGYCEYKGMPLGWIPPTLLPGSWYFEQQDEFGWLRTAMGGLCTSCGLLHIGNPESDTIKQYNFPDRHEEHYGVHDRMAMLPAQLLSYGDTWKREDCWLNASGRMIQSQVYAENLVVNRIYTAKIGEKRFFMHDQVINEGYYQTPIMLLYHLNFGFPFVDEGSKLISMLSEPAKTLAGGKELNDDSSYAVFSKPKQGADLQVFGLQPNTNKDGTAGVAIIQPALGESGMGVYLRYKPEQFPKLFETRMMGEGHYFVSLEPATNDFGRAELRNRGELKLLNPGEQRKFDIEIGVLEGSEEIGSFQRSLTI